MSIRSSNNPIVTGLTYMGSDSFEYRRAVNFALLPLHFILAHTPALHIPSNSFQSPIWRGLTFHARLELFWLAGSSQQCWFFLWFIDYRIHALNLSRFSGIVTAQAFSYFKSYPDDAKAIKLLVGELFSRLLLVA